MSAELWERQKSESNRAYGAFCEYRDMGPARGIRKCTGSGTRWSQLIRWSKKYEWVRRVTAYDDQLDQKRRQENEKEILEMGKRHAKTALLLQSVALERLQKLDPEELGATEIRRFVIEAARLEREARGQPSSTVRQEHTGKDGGVVRIVFPEGFAGV